MPALASVPAVVDAEELESEELEPEELELEELDPESGVGLTAPPPPPRSGDEPVEVGDQDDRVPPGSPSWHPPQRDSPAPPESPIALPPIPDTDKSETTTTVQRWTIWIGLDWQHDDRAMTVAQTSQQRNNDEATNNQHDNAAMQSQ